VSVHTLSASFLYNVPDTIVIDYRDDEVRIFNPRIDYFQITADKANVTVTSTGGQPFVCRATGNSSDGRLVIDADTTLTLVLDNLNLASQQASAIYLRQKQQATIELPAGTISSLQDAPDYHPADTTESANGCLYVRGSLNVIGEGSLTVTGNNRHGIVSGKNIIVEDAHLIINNVVKNGIHCDKFTLFSGDIGLTLANDASKGIKAKENISILGGQIEGEATGGITIADDDTSYSSLLKSDGTMIIAGGTLSLIHNGSGGRCISVDKNLTITGGSFDMACFGDGGRYLTAENDSDYFTPKCITVDGTARIERGRLSLLATGKGGKGIACSDTLVIGRMGDFLVSEDSLLIQVETYGWCLVDNTIEDYRLGCPKAIKSDGDVYIYSGTLRVKTHGQGGEGIESKGSLRTYNATIMAECYDDGINTGQRFVCNGSRVFCLSHHNDGIDSNGKCSIIDGIVAAVSEDEMNESFDTEGERLYLYGGSVIGICNNEIPVSELSTVCYYSTHQTTTDWGQRHGDSITIQPGQYLTVSKGDNTIISLLHQYANDDAFILVTTPTMTKEGIYQIYDGMKPTMPVTEWFDGNVVIGGTLTGGKPIYEFIPQ
jgi:hypothetical protein